jgi:Bacteriophage lambda head decoration protein D
MDLSMRTETFGQEDQSWLGSAHGTDMARSITLDVSTFTANTHYPQGFLLSGLPLGKITATGKYGPYNDAQTDGTQTLAGFLLTGVRVNTLDNTIDVQGALYIHGVVVAAKLPVAVDAAGQADVAGRIIFV